MGVEGEYGRRAGLASEALNSRDSYRQVHLIGRTTTLVLSLAEEGRRVSGGDDADIAYCRYGVVKGCVRLS